MPGMRRDAAAIVLAGGMSRRMGAPKALLEWHGTPLVHRIAGILARVCDPVIVVTAAGQALALPPDVEVAVDAAPGRGPLEGIAAGVRALGGRTHAVFLAATDLPLLHPDVVAHLLDSLPGYDAAVVVAGGHDQSLAAAYEARLLARAPQLLADGRPRVAALLDGARVNRLEAGHLDDPEAFRAMNTQEDYRELHGLPQPAVTISAPGAEAVEVEAATLGAAVGCVAGSSGAAQHPIALVNGVLVPPDPATPLVSGDVVELRATRPSR
jgi:molybdenum cofactor guanylyltransferase